MKMGHFTEKMREQFIELLETDNKEKWWDSFKTPELGLEFLEQFWNCKDIVPRSAREDAEQWFVYMGCTPQKVTQIRQGASYAKLVRLMKPIVEYRIHSLRKIGKLQQLSEVN